MLFSLDLLISKKTTKMGQIFITTAFLFSALTWFEVFKNGDKTK